VAAVSSPLICTRPGFLALSCCSSRPSGSVSPSRLLSRFGPRARRLGDPAHGDRLRLALTRLNAEPRRGALAGTAARHTYGTAPTLRSPRLMLPACEKFSMYPASEGAKTLAGRAAPLSRARIAAIFATPRFSTRHPSSRLGGKRSRVNRFGGAVITLSAQPALSCAALSAPGSEKDQPKRP